jgi:hypothetical protein
MLVSTVPKFPRTQVQEVPQKVGSEWLTSMILLIMSMASSPASLKSESSMEVLVEELIDLHASSPTFRQFSDLHKRLSSLWMPSKPLSLLSAPQPSSICGRSNFWRRSRTLVQLYLSMMMSLTLRSAMYVYRSSSDCDLINIFSGPRYASTSGNNL